MKIKNHRILFITMASFMFLISLISCGTSESDSIEYVNEEVAYLDGDACVERYLLDEEKGTYKRYVAGIFYGIEVPGIYFGTLFETGTYTTSENEDGDALKITFSPKKRYNFEKNQLENLGLGNQLPYYGTLTDTTLTITYEILEDYYIRSIKKGEVSIEYKRK